MNPVIYSASETAFDTLGLGVMNDVISCKATEEKNGTYEVEMQIPVGCTGYENVKVDNIISVLAHKGDAAPDQFRIYYIEESADTLTATVYARQIALHRMEYDVIYAGLSGTSAQNFVYNLNNPSSGNWHVNGDPPYTIKSTITTAGSFSITAPTTLKDIFLGDENSLVSTFGGVMQYEGNAVKHTTRGSDNGVIVRYGKNVTAMTSTTDAASVVTGIIPYWQKTDDDSPETAYYSTVYATDIMISTGASTTAFDHYVPVDCSSEISAPEDAEEGWMPTRAEVQAWGESYIASNYDGSIPITYTVSFVDEPGSDIDTVSLCDTVTVQHEKLGINIKTEVVKVVYDCIAERWESIELGTVAASIARNIDRIFSRPKYASAAALNGVTGKVYDSTEAASAIASNIYTSGTTTINGAKITSGSIPTSALADGIVDTTARAEAEAAQDTADANTASISAMATSISTNSLTLGGHSSAVGSVVQSSKTTATSCANNTNVAIGSISLPAGVWTVSVDVGWAKSGTGYRSQILATSNNPSWSFSTSYAYALVLGSSESTMSVNSTCILSPTATTTYYLNLWHSNGSALNCSGYRITAVRIA